MGSDYIELPRAESRTVEHRRAVLRSVVGQTNDLVPVEVPCGQELRLSHAFAERAVTFLPRPSPDRGVERVNHLLLRRKIREPDERARAISQRRVVELPRR